MGFNLMGADGGGGRRGSRMRPRVIIVSTLEDVVFLLMALVWVLVWACACVSLGVHHAMPSQVERPFCC